MAERLRNTPPRVMARPPRGALRPGRFISRAFRAGFLGRDAWCGKRRKPLAVTERSGSSTGHPAGAHLSPSGRFAPPNDSLESLHRAKSSVTRPARRVRPNGPAHGPADPSRVPVQGPGERSVSGASVGQPTERRASGVGRTHDRGLRWVRRRGRKKSARTHLNGGLFRRLINRLQVGAPPWEVARSRENWVPTSIP